MLAVAKPTTRTLPGTHQPRGKRRISASAAAAPPPAKTAPMAVDLATSPSHGPQSWVESPTSTARWWLMALTGSWAAAKPTERATPAPAATSTGRRNGPRSGAGGRRTSHTSSATSIAVPAAKSTSWPWR